MTNDVTRRTLGANFHLSVNSKTNGFIPIIFLIVDRFLLVVLIKILVKYGQICVE